MTIKNLLLAVASLVESRDIIDHGTIRCLYSNDAVRSIESAEDLGDDEVGTGTIGDDTLAERIRELAEEPGDIDVDDIVHLERAFRGEDVADYVDEGHENELAAMDVLIKRARLLVA